MNERIVKFILMMAVVLLIGTGATMLNLNLHKGNDTAQAKIEVNFADMETLQTEGILLSSDESDGREMTEFGMTGEIEDAETEKAESAEAESAIEELESEIMAMQETVARIEAQKANNKAMSMEERACGPAETSELADTEITTEEMESDDWLLATEGDLEAIRDAMYKYLADADGRLTKMAEDAAKKPVADQKAVADEALKFWDDKLNEVYQDLRDLMSEDEFIVLRDEERAWIRSRDEAANQAAKAENYSNSYQSLAYTRSLVEWTKERVYVLMEMLYRP